MMYQMARMSVEDGLVMTIHPGSFRNHHEPTFEAFGADTGHDIPFAIELHRGHPPAAAGLRHRQGLPPGAVHPGRDRVLPRTRTAGRASTRPSTSVRRGGSSMPRTPCCASAPPSPRPPDSPAPPASSTTPARSAPSRPGTMPPAGSRPRSWPGSWRSTGSARTVPHEIIVDLVDSSPRRVFKL